MKIERSDDGMNFITVGSHTFGPQIDAVVQYNSISYESFANNDAYADYDYLSGSPITKAHAVLNK